MNTETNQTNNTVLFVSNTANGKISIVTLFNKFAVKVEAKNGKQWMEVHETRRNVEIAFTYLKRDLETMIFLPEDQNGL